MREARNPQGSTPLFRSAPVVRFETCAHGARIWQPKNLMREARNPQGSTPLFRSAPVVRFETCAHGARIWQPKNLTACRIS